MGDLENYAPNAVMCRYATQASNAWQMTNINTLPYSLVGLEAACFAGANAAIVVTCTCAP